MAKISNTTSYPNAAASPTDYVIGTDVSDNNNTKTFTLQDIANLNAFSPGSGTVTSVGLSAGTTGLTITSDTVNPITATGTFTLGGTLATANGGTGLSSLTEGSLLIGDSSTYISALAIGTNNYVLTSNGTTATWAEASSGGPGSGTIGRMAYWTTGANPGVLGSAPIKYTPASSDPAVEELTEIISNSATHQIKIGTEANSGALVLGSTSNVSTTIGSGGSINLFSPDSVNLNATASNGAVNLFTQANNGAINIQNNNAGTGAITSSINIGLPNGSPGWLADSINMFKDVNIANIVSFSTLVGANFALNKKIQLSRNDSNVGGPSASLFIDQTTTSAAGTSNIWTAVSTTVAQKCISFAYNLTEVGFIRPASTSAIEIGGYTSDERLKTDIVDWDDKVLDKFKAINPKKYKYTKDKELGIEKEFKGFIAQDMQDKFPEAYKKDLPTEEGGLEYYYFDPIAMITPLMKAIKELNEKIESLEAKVKENGENK